LPQVCALSIKDGARFFDALELSAEQPQSRIEFCLKSDADFVFWLMLVDYLTLDRLAQRFRAAKHSGFNWRRTWVLHLSARYVLDEPSIVYIRATTIA